MRRTTNLTTKGREMKNVKTATKSASKESELGRLTTLVKMLRKFSTHPEGWLTIGAACNRAERQIAANTSEEHTAKKTFRLWAAGVLPSVPLGRVRAWMATAELNNVQLHDVASVKKKGRGVSIKFAS
jgi:hypothetical protein